MAQNLKQLAQLRPANDTAVSIYSPAASTETIIKTVVVSNTSGSDVKLRIFHDDDGTTFDETTSLFWDILLFKENSFIAQINMMMDNSAGNLGVRTDTANALTFTVYGSEIT